MMIVTTTAISGVAATTASSATLLQAPRNSSFVPRAKLCGYSTAIPVPGAWFFLLDHPMSRGSLTFSQVYGSF